MHDPEMAYREFQATLRQYLARRLGNADDVEDVLQDVFLRVTRNRTALENAQEPLAWLYSVAKTALIDHVRRQRKHAAVATGGVPEDIPDTQSDMPSEGFYECLTPLLKNLSEAYRDAIRYVDIEGGRQTDLAAASGLNVSTVKSRVQRGRRQLKSAIVDCCLIERDALENISGLAPGNCDPECC